MLSSRDECTRFYTINYGNLQSTTPRRNDGLPTERDSLNYSPHRPPKLVPPTLRAHR